MTKNQLEQLQKREWHSLTQLKDYFMREGVDVKSFNGFELVTDTHSFAIALGELFIYKLKK